VSESITLESTETEIGTLHLTRREVEGASGWVYEILIGTDVLMTSLSPISERQLSVSALALHAGEGPLRVLVGGLGLGYTAQAVLEDARVQKLRVVEKMDFVIDWMQRGLLPLSDEFSKEERLQIAWGDVYRELLGPATERYDLILVDVDHAPDDPLSEESLPFYTTRGQKQVADHLRPGGILGVWSAVENAHFSQVLAEVYPESHQEEVAWQDVEFPEADYANVVFFARKQQA
jgi:spermidine synthase